MPRLSILLFVFLALIAPRLAFADSIAAKKLDAAAAAANKEDWSTAASLYRELATENPRNGLFWYELGSAQYYLKNYREAIAAYDRAIAVGHQVGLSQYNKGCCHALLGETKPAIDAIENAIRSGLRGREELLRTDKDLDSLRDTAEFRARILPAVMPETPRADAWRIDMDYLTKRVEETHYDPWRHISRDEWNAEIARIQGAVPSMKDHEVIVALMQLMVRIGDGHTVVAAPRAGKYMFHQLPLRIFDFKDGLYVYGGAPEYANLIGKRLVRIGNTPGEKALEMVATTTQRDNPQQIRWLGPRYMMRIEVLNALGIVKGLESAEIVVADAKGKESKMTVKAIPIPQGQHGNEVVPEGWIDMAEKTDTPPLWRKEPDKLFTAEYLSDSKLVYANFRAVVNDPHETVEQFGDRAIALADSKNARALVIDVRTNNGGNNFLARAFLESIIGSSYNDDGRLFVITGRETFSACQNFCNWLDRQTAALFAGEPTGSRPNFVGEGNIIVLPYSGLEVSASSRFWQDSVSEDMRLWIAPEFEAEMTSEDYRKNRDPAFAAILEYLNTRATAVPAGTGR
jgi:tetratricopeptide (TPR) repeat protein